MNEDLVSAGLREITHRLGGSDAGLGGEYGYGTNYDSDVFMMHRYCWCEEEDCPWCTDLEGVSAPNFHHKASGFKVCWYKYIGRSMKIENPNNADFVKILAECCRDCREIQNAS